MTLFLSCASAQDKKAGAAVVGNLAVARDGKALRLEIDVSSTVNATVQYATNPDRLVLDLPNATYNADSKTIEVNSNGVRRVRLAVHSVNPPVVRLVVDLDQAHEHTLSSNAGRITLTVLPAETTASRKSQGALAAGSSGGFLGVFKRQNKSVPEDPDSSLATPVNPVPPAQRASAPSSLATTVPPPGNPVATVPQSDPTHSPQSSAGQPHFEPQIAAAQTTTAATPGSADNLAVAAPPSPGPNLQNPATATERTGGATAASALPPTNGAQGDTAPAVSRGEDNDKAATSGSEGPTLIARPLDPSLRTVFKVKYVAEGVAYLDGGRSAGLAEGMKLEIEDSNLPAEQGMAVDPADPKIAAELEVSALAETSAVTEIHSPKRPVKVGDLAYLSNGDAEALVQQRALSATRKYPAVISFTEGDTLDEEVHDALPKPPSPAVNRARGRIGVDYMGTVSHGSGGMTTSDLGMILRTDITRINGTYWNASGYWRGRLSSQTPPGQQTLQDLINRTYHLEMTYENPNSAWVAGFGRLYLPWASSLDTIDGGYFGRRLSKIATVGVFGGSTPDPTSWTYAPDQVLSGSFINFEGGDYQAWHYSSTSGGGISMLKWQINKPFAFLENTISYNRYVSVYDALQVDNPAATPATPSPGWGLGRNFFTLRVQPHPRLELDFNENYFRDVPTFDPQLIGTGLLDKYLFQGISVGTRVEVKKQIFVYTTIGQSNRTGDAKTSLNQMYGVTLGHLPWWGLRADAHYSQFSSSFGTGSYKSFSLSRNLGDDTRVEVLVGDQRFSSQFTNNNSSRFITGNVETNFGAHYFLQGGFTTERGNFSYDQWMFTLGYRFDSRQRHREQ